jgi:FlaA1/EpsC-like NDP-sugar epimerase
VNRATASLLALPRGAKAGIAFGVDAFLCLFSVWAALSLRIGEWVNPTGNQLLAIMASFVALPIFIKLDLYRAILRHASGPALIAIARAVLLYALVFAGLFTFVGVTGIPRTVGLIQPALLFLLISLSRVTASFWLGDSRPGGQKRTKEKRVLVYGAGAAGRQLAAALRASSIRIVGFLDDDPKLIGRTLHGYPIHSGRDAPSLIPALGVTDVLLAIPSASRKRRHEILETVRRTTVEVRTLPGVTELAEGRVEISDLRELDLEDLLGRSSVEPDVQLFERNIRGKTVLVTGAGGSIGSELCRQILKAEPSTLLLLDLSEAALFAIHEDLRHKVGGDEDSMVRLVPLIGSVCDEARVREIVSAWRPQTVYHAAAYKHVPLVEHNPIEGVRNNVFGTLALALAAQELEVENFVLISTDKAVRPTNVMGTSKRLAEQVLQALASLGSHTCFSMVRFGNVLGSSGSVVPVFRNQIKRGGPITITHPEITRYFMTIPEAAQLVIQAGAMACGGEVFVLDMGQPVKIVDLARNMIELSGRTMRDDDHPDGDIEIKTVGLRPGEKLYEELLIGDNPTSTSHPRILQAREHYLPWPQLQDHLKQLSSAVSASDVGNILLLLRHSVPEYRSEGAVVDWVHMERKTG